MVPDIHSGLYPKYMYLNRGNHEAKDMNRSYGFEGEAKHKHGEQSYKVCFPPIGHISDTNKTTSQLFAYVFTTSKLTTHLVRQYALIYL